MHSLFSLIDNISCPGNDVIMKDDVGVPVFDTNNDCGEFIGFSISNCILG